MTITTEVNHLKCEPTDLRLSSGTTTSVLSMHNVSIYHIIIIFEYWFFCPTICCWDFALIGGNWCQLRQLAPVTAPVISASCHQFLRQLPPVSPPVMTSNWRRNWWQLAEITGANWRSWHQLKSPYKSTRILDLISKKSYGKWKYEWYLVFHNEIGTECDHTPLEINDFKTNFFWSEIDDLCSKISWMRRAGWPDEKIFQI